MIRRLRAIRHPLKTLALAALIVASVIVEPVEAIIQGSGQIVYSEGTTITPRNREFRNQENTWINETGFGGNTSVGTHQIVRASPTRNEMIAGSVNTAGVLRIYVWNGSTWASQFTVTVGASTTPRFAIAYLSSGNALVFYSTNTATTNEIAARTWTGTVFSAAQTYNPTRTSGIVDSMVAKTDPVNGYIMLAWVDVNKDISADYFLAATSPRGEPSAALDTNVTTVAGAARPDTQNFDIAFEEVSGRAMVVWGSSAYSGLRTVMRTNGIVGTWQTIQTPSAFQSQGLILQMVSRPGTNDIAYINHSNWRSPGMTANGIEASVWNGTTWTSSAYYTPTTAVIGERDVGLAWLTSGGVTKAVFTFDGASSAGLDYVVYDRASNTFGAAQVHAGAPSPAAGDKVNRMISNPFDAAEALALVTSGTSIYAKKATFDGTNVTWANTTQFGGETVMEANLPSSATTAGWYLDFDFNKFIPTPLLTTDFTTDADVSVANPSFAFSGTATASTCQTTTGTLGDATNQLIRVFNTTNNPAWTLTIAPTGGPIANWSSGTESYDFNDPGSSGCGEGGDDDGLPGQLSMTPISGTHTPNKSGCTGSNLSRGSAASFSEGVTDSITLLTGSASAQIDCIWSMYNVPMSQKIPAYTLPGSYSLPMTVTITAS